MLCAGRGSRMGAMTQAHPKCLLPVGEKRVLDLMLDELLPYTKGEIVVVTGFAAESVERHLASYGGRVRCVFNSDFERDVNVLSVDIGLGALHHPERGYLIVETDLLLDASAWSRIRAALRTPDSFWVCRGRYGPDLTGGIVRADDNGFIDRVDYQPKYDQAYDGWHKMVGLLAVGAGQVEEDRRQRRAVIGESIAEYYLVPWKRGISSLPCRVLSVDGCFAASFNTAAEFDAVVRAYCLVQRETGKHAAAGQSEYGN